MAAMASTDATARLARPAPLVLKASVASRVPTASTARIPKTARMEPQDRLESAAGTEPQEQPAPRAARVSKA